VGDSINAKFVGFPELMNALKLMSDAVAEKHLKTAALAGGLPIQNAAKEKAPRKTANLVRSIHEMVVTAGKDYVQVAIGTDLIYAAIHEYGGEIVPKHGKFLAIPLTKTAETYKPRDYPEPLHVVIGKGSSSGVLMTAGNEVIYALVKKVTIPAHPYMRPAFDEQQEKALATMGDVLGKLIDGAWKK
jgi:HK97 gp10 family phage protein